MITIDRPVGARSAAPASRNQKAQMLATPSTKILVIDDHALTRSLLKGLLKDAGYHAIREAMDGDAGVKLAQYFGPDLICLDMAMPGRSGLEMLGPLKEVAPRASILMVTANSERDTVVNCLNAGASGYIIKPFNAATVLRVIESALRKRGTGGQEISM